MCVPVPTSDLLLELKVLTEQNKILRSDIQHLNAKLDVVLKILGPQLHTVRYYPSRYERLELD